MKINLEILDAVYLYSKDEIKDLNTKDIVPQMLFRRRLTKAAKLVIELLSNFDIENKRIIHGSSQGELLSTANILKAILYDDMLSPTDFQNSVYNTAVSYASMLYKNTKEILTVSSGDETSLKALKVTAIKALDKDELVLVCCETLNIPNIQEINKCIDFLEVAVALRVKISNEKSTINLDNIYLKDFPASIRHILHIAQNFDKSKKNILEVKI